MTLIGGLHGAMLAVQRMYWYVKTGTSHGAAYSYDTHVPIVFMGYGIRPGATAAPVSVKDIAPTLAVLLFVENPNGTTGKAIQSIVERP